MRLILIGLSILVSLGGGCMTSSGSMPVPDQLPIFRIGLPSGDSRPLMIAHRCGAGLGPENTRGAVVQSSFYRPDYFEIDIRHTMDGIPVVLHDSSLARTTNISGEIGNFRWDEIEDMDAGSWFSSTFMWENIPTFESILDSVNPSPLCIEIKEPDITESQCDALIRLLNEKNDVSSVVFSFHITALDTFRLAEKIFSPEGDDLASGFDKNFIRRTCFLTTEINDYALKGPHEIVGILKSACTLEIVEEVHSAGKAVWVWTVNDPGDMRRFMLMNIDGIVTDYPDRLREILPPS